MKKQLTIQQVASMGGKARAKSLTPARRSEIATLAVQAREEKRLIHRKNKITVDNDVASKIR